MTSIKELVILSWNILDGGRDKLDRISDKIKSLKPNIITIQECIDWNNDKIKLFSQKINLPYFAISHPSFTTLGKNSYAVIFSNFPLKNISKFDGSNHGVVGATITTEIGDVRFYGIHLHYRNDPIKLKGLSSINKDAKDWKNVILAGDFNSLTEEDDWEASRLIGDKGYVITKKTKSLGYQDSFLQLHDFKASKKLGEAHTYPSSSFKDKMRKETNQKESRKRIDYVFVSKSLISRLKSIKVLQIEYSDHYPLYCKINLD